MVVVIAPRRVTRDHGKHMLTKDHAEFSVYCIYQEIFSIMSGITQKQINEMVANYAVVYKYTIRISFLACLAWLSG